MSNHQLKFLGNSNTVSDAAQIAEMQLINGINSRVFSFAVWNVGEDLSEKNLQSNEMEDMIYLSGFPDEELYIENKSFAYAQMMDALHELRADDFMNTSSYEKLVKNCVNYHENGETFEQIIPFEDQHMSLRYLILDEELARVIEQAINKESIDSKDIIDIGKLIDEEHSLQPIEIGSINFLQKPFLQAIDNQNFSKEEKEYINLAFDSLQLDKPDSLLEKDNAKELNRKKVIQQNQEYTR